MVVGQFGVDLVAIVVVVGERSVDLRRRQVGIGLADLVVCRAVLVQEDYVVDADASSVDPGLAEANVRRLDDVRKPFPLPERKAFSGWCAKSWSRLLQGEHHQRAAVESEELGPASLSDIHLYMT